MKRTILISLYLLLSFLITGEQTNTVFAAETCAGTVRDATGNSIPQASVSAHFGNSGINLVAETNNNGEYSFLTHGFGVGAMLIKQMIFGKTGFQALVMDTFLPPKDICPGNVVLSTPPPPTQAGYACDPDQGCMSVTSNAQYTTSDVCSADCKKQRYEPSQNACNYPDSKYHSQSLECSKVTLTPGGFLIPIPTSPPPPPSPRCVTNLVNGKCLAVFTGLGFAIATEALPFVERVFGIILSLSGGVALLLIILSGYKLMLSQGNPEKAQEAKETLTAAIVGLLFIIFSLVILQVIGVDILKIPGFQ